MRNSLNQIDQLEAGDPDFAAIAQVVRQQARKAVEQGLPFAHLMSVETLSPLKARAYLAEMIAARRATKAGRTTETVSDDAPLTMPLTVAQAAKRFNLGKRTIYRLVETGEIEAPRIGKAIRIRPADLEAYLGRSQGPRAGLFA